MFSFASSLSIAHNIISDPINHQKQRVFDTVMKNRPKNSLYLALPFMLLARVHTSFSFVIEPSQHARNNLPLAHPHATKLQMGIDDSDMEVLRKRIEKQETQYAKLLMEQSKYEISDDFDDDSDEMRPLPQSVHIILFLPETPEQHVHTIEIPKGSGNNVLLAFEDEGECHMFAEMLVRDLGFVDPCVSESVNQKNV